VGSGVTSAYVKPERSISRVARFVASLPIAVFALTLTGLGIAFTWLAGKCWAAGARLMRN
jgi:hypothetical protein